MNLSAILAMIHSIYFAKNVIKLNEGTFNVSIWQNTASFSFFLIYINKFIDAEKVSTPMQSNKR